MRRCKCYAHSSDECVCGAWADRDPTKLQAKIAKLRAENRRLKSMIMEITEYVPRKEKK